MAAGSSRKDLTHTLWFGQPRSLAGIPHVVHLLKQWAWPEKLRQLQSFSGVSSFSLFKSLDFGAYLIFWTNPQG